MDYQGIRYILTLVPLCAINPGMARILVVDDEKDSADMMRFILEHSGHTVTVAYNGAEALEELGVDPEKPEASLPDLVLLDVMMPIVDGHTVSVKMRQCPRTERLPIIVVTAHGDALHLFTDAPNVAGCQHKPFDPDELKKLVETTLAKGS